MRGGLSAQTLDRELTSAMNEVLGCGGQVDEQKLQRIERELEPMWRTLQKNAAGNIDRRSLRYLVHRRFNRRSSLHIRGFEPTRATNASGWGSADILSQRVPAFVESVLESQHKAETGFRLRDAVQMVAALEQMIFDSEGALLQTSYKNAGQSPRRSLDENTLSKVLETYMVRWMLGDDQESASYLLRNRSLIESTLPHWDEVAAYARGQVISLQHKRRVAPGATSADGLARPGHNAMSPRYSFEDAHAMVGEITKSFASFWESQCDSMKLQLVEMDTHQTGRVPLAKFYGTGLDADWRFGESEEYLRELGALDETSWRGKQVIIPNYIQAASNCIVSGQHYLVCCANDCETLLDDIERAVAAPTARPETIIDIVANMSSHINVDDDRAPKIDSSLRTQLAQIAEAHGGEVPIHGRLFGQWLHYVFPRECPFPHKTGVTVSSTPTQYGEGYIASAEEMKKYASEANNSALPTGVDREELEWMSQWSPEEELITDHLAHGLRAPWERSGLAAGAALFVAFVALSAFGLSSGRKLSSGGGLLPTHQKAHYV